MISTFGGWLTIGLQLLTLVTVVFSAVKIINRNVKEWEARELRLTAIEKELADMRSSTRELVAMSTKLTDMVGEIQRIRDRLDRFLDNQGQPQQVH